MMMTNTDAFTCSICQQLYTNPVVHRPCGFSFDRQCLTDKCPIERCGQVIREDDLVINYDFSKAISEYRLRLETPCAYYMILLDTSTSMWYSDGLLPFAIGKSRFTYALQFLNDFFDQHLDSTTNKISLVTFDTAQLERFPFDTISRTHLDMLPNLTCEGTDTALFDSIDYCLDRIEQLQTIVKNAMPIVYLIVLTDGGNNFGKKECEHAVAAAWRSKQLHISGHMIQIGDKNRRKTRRICDFIQYKFNHINNGNARDFVNSFTNAIKTETRARVAKTRDHASRIRSRTAAAQPVMDSISVIINQLPDPPKTPVRILSKEKVLA